MKRFLATAALALSVTAANADTLQVQSSDGYMNVRTGPGTNYPLLGSAPNGTRYHWPGRPTCVPRQDGIAGPPWCKIDYNGRPGWISTAGLMPVVRSNSRDTEVRSGSWSAFKTVSDQGVPMCGLKIVGSDRELYFKYAKVGDNTSVQLFKSTWHFGENNEVPLTIGFDKNDMISLTGKTFVNQGVSFVEFLLPNDRLEDFLHEFGEADKMWVRFESGNEQPWVADMVGSRNAATMFRQCMPTLPDVTQPFGESSATSPLGPKKDQSKPVAKKDDGSI